VLVIARSEDDAEALIDSISKYRGIS